MHLFPRWHRLRVLRNHPIPDGLWFELTPRLPLLHGLDAIERARLRELSTLFLHDKHFTGVQGLELSEEMRLVIAAQACLPILELGPDAYAGWVEIVVYPAAFRVSREVTDEFGIVHREERGLSGESWGAGPVILAWEEVERDSFRLRHGHNVVVHEFAHKLDLLNGRANGLPPLHPDMPIEAWSRALGEAYERLIRRIEQHHRPFIDPYAATDPAEFFAVVCEYFFTAPEVLQEHCPAVYEQLRRYFRQDPLQRLRQAARGERTR
ncbi:MAG TPA: zinc-dependent peptidase [Gammaproteobacteria bacterium]|nr:zinc-dependent peptidase [Gammaproteobacteria bacterium]